MEAKEESNTLGARVSGVEEVNLKHETVRIDHQLEHELTVKDVFTRHPALVWWAFYWSMAGVGW